jgi:hypothetical protein
MRNYSQFAIILYSLFQFSIFNFQFSILHFAFCIFLYA